MNDFQNIIIFTKTEFSWLQNKSYKNMVLRGELKLSLSSFTILYFTYFTIIYTNILF